MTHPPTIWHSLGNSHIAPAVIEKCYTVIIAVCGINFLNCHMPKEKVDAAFLKVQWGNSCYT